MDWKPGYIRIYLYVYNGDSVIMMAGLYQWVTVPAYHFLCASTDPVTVSGEGLLSFHTGS